jgi:hypothetical protein
VEGLREGGWQGDSDLVRLAYTAWTALYSGACAPAFVASWSATQAIAEQQYGRPFEVMASGWAAMCEFALDCGDEARELMDKLGF